MAADGSHPLTFREVLSEMERAPAFAVTPILLARRPWKPTLEQRGGQWFTPMEVQVFRLGDCALVAHAADVFNEIGVEIKQGSPAPFTLFVGYGNGYVGNLLPAAEHALGGPEVEVSPYFLRMPGPLDPSSAELVTRHSLDLLQALWPGEE
jgi:hypothetical protein